MIMFLENESFVSPNSMASLDLCVPYKQNYHSLRNRRIKIDWKGFILGNWALILRNTELVL